MMHRPQRVIALVALFALAAQSQAPAGGLAAPPMEQHHPRNDHAPHVSIHLRASAVSASEIRLTWSDNSRKETGFKIERAPNRHGSPGTWSQIASVGPNATTLIDTSVSANRTYWYRVRAQDKGGNSDYSNRANATTLPRPPSNLSATATSTNQVNLSWTPDPDGQNGFKIERAPDIDGGPGTWRRIATAAACATTYRDRGLAPGTRYWYRVRAFNFSGGSVYSDVASAVTLQPPCPLSIVQWGETFGNPPAGLTDVVAIAAGGSNSLALKNDGTVIVWGDNSLGQTTLPTNLTGVVAIAAGEFHSLALKNDGTVVGWGYDYYGESTPPAGLSNVVAIAAGSYHSLALRSDGTVVGWGYNDDGEATPPVGLSNVVAIAAGGYHGLALRSDGTVVGWGANDDGEATPPAGLTNVVFIAGGQYFSMALNGDGTVIVWGDNSLGQTTLPTNLTGVVAIAAGANHCLALKNDGTVVGWGSDFYGQATPPAGLTRVTAIAGGYYHSLALTLSPAAPTAFAATVMGPHDIDLSWTGAPEGVTEFKIERAPDANGSPGSWAQIAAVGAGTTNYSDRTVTTNATYWYRLRSSAHCGDSPYTSPVSASVNPPAAPSSLTASAVALRQVDLSWTDNSFNEDGFIIERAQDAGGMPGAWSPIATVGADTVIYVDTNATVCTTYWYRVRAYNLVGYSPDTDPASAIIGPPAAPSGLTAAATDVDRVDLSWVDNSFNEENFKIERADDAGGVPGTWAQIATAGAGVTFYSDQGVTTNHAYWYRVRASNTCGDSPYSNEASVIVAPPAPASNLTATAVALTQIMLCWTDNSTDEDGFKIDRSLDGTNFTQIAQLPANTTNYLNTGLFPGTAYYYRVRAYKSSGGSTPSNVAGAVTPAPPCPMSVVGWGDNSFGQVTPPTNLTGVVAIAAGYFQTLALKSDGTVVGWGYSYYATPPTGLTGVVAIASGLLHGLALKSDGTVVGWGDNSMSQAIPPADLTGVAAVSGGYEDSLALKSDGTVVGWGTDTSGERTPPAGLSNAVAIAAGYTHSLALKSDGTVVGWGDNSYGQTTTPGGLTGVVAIAAGGYHSLALKSDGTVACWGANWYGQVTPPAGLTGVVAVAGGALHSLALKSDGTVVGWGYNDDGEATPAAGLSNAVAIAGGVYHSVALTTAPAAPATLTATPVAGNQVDLSWAANPVDGDGFKIERAPDSGGSPGTWAQIATTSANVTSYSDTAVVTNSTYWYRVRASNTCGDSPYSNQAITSAAPPAAPSNLTATAVAANQVNLSWVDNSINEAGFAIERAPDAGGSPGAWTQITTTGANVTNYSDTAVVTNTTYWYRVQAFNALGDSLPSDPASVRVAPPAAPSNLTAIAVAVNEVDLSWSGDLLDTLGFQIERAPDDAGSPGTWLQIAAVGADVTVYRDRDVVANTTCWYRVRAYNLLGESPYSDPVSVTIVASLPTVILDDTWADGTRANQNLPTESAWFTSSSSGGPLTASPGAMTLTIGGSSALIITYFTPNSSSPPVWLNVGDTLTATFSFVFDGVPTASSTSQGFRLGLFNFAGSALSPKRVSSDGSFSSSSQGNGVQGYALFQKMYTQFADNLPIDIRKRTALSDSSLLGSSGDWTSLAKGGDISNFPGFANRTPYNLQFLLQRTGLNSMVVTMTWMNMIDGSTLSTSTTDNTATNFSFDGIAYRPQNSSQAPATNQFKEVRIEVSSVPIAPFIVGQPLNQSVASGQTAAFSVAVNGTLPLSYQWYFNTNTPLANATNSVLTLADSQLADVGTYFVVVSNSYGVASSAAATLAVTNVGPTILTQPQDLTLIPGQDAAFGVVVAGSEPLTYQWYYSTSSLLTNATGASLTLSNVQPGDAGSYSVVVSNPVGSVVSSNAILTINTNPVLPIFITQPASLTVWAGESASFSAVALGNSPVRYQWNKDGVPIPGATSSNLTLTPVQLDDAGSYTLVASNSVGSTTSSNAILVVESRIPPLPVIPTNQFNILNYGAIGDGVSDNASAIQSAINAAAAAGGGTVVVPSAGANSTYLSGPISLASAINLQIDSGAMLQMLPMSNWPSASTPFINGSGLNDVEISGSGTIDGQGTNWWFPKAASRPNFISFNGCVRILVQDVRLQNPPTFHLMLKGNNVGVTVQRITIDTPGNSPNTDGMDLASSNVLIQSCYISDGDDNIEIGGSGGPAADITVVNCAFGAGHGVSIGSITSGGVHDLIVSNCTFNGTDYGIRMKSDNDRGGLVQNLQYCDIIMTNVGYPLVIYSYYNLVGTPNNIDPATVAGIAPQPVFDTTPIWRDILVSNVTATASTGSGISGIIWGRPEMLVSNVTLCRVNISDPDKSFDIYNAQGILIIDSSLTAPGSTNTLMLYNAEVTVTNSAAGIQTTGQVNLAVVPWAPSF